MVDQRGNLQKVRNRSLGSLCNPPGQDSLQQMIHSPHNQKGHAATTCLACIPEDSIRPERHHRLVTRQAFLMDTVVSKDFRQAAVSDGGICLKEFKPE